MKMSGSTTPGAEGRSSGSIPPLLEGAWGIFGDSPGMPAVLDGPETWTWRRLMDEVARTADLLGSVGVSGPVGILLPSGISFLSGFLAAASLGRPACTLHPDWADPEVEAAIEDAGLSLILTDRQETPTGITAVDPGTTSPLSSRDLDLFPMTPRAEDDPRFYIGFTSGTSGRPKPFTRRQRSWASSFAPAGDLFGIEVGDEVLLPGSLQHSHFLFGAFLGLNRGASIRLFDHFDATRLVDHLSRTSRGVLYMVPTMLLSLDELKPGSFEGVHSLVVSGAKLEPHHREIARRLFPKASVNEIYGASELSFVTVNSDGGAPDDAGFVGRPFPGVEIQIRPTGEDSDDGAGQVFVRSPYLFDGYLHGAETDLPTDGDGFMTVGDIGTLTPRGLSLSGRASNLLITGGKNVHPEEVETSLGDHPSVIECVVAGVPHPHWGEELVAFVVAPASVRPDADELKLYLRERLASYKIPKRWFLVEAIPRTPAGKTDRATDRLFDGAIEI